MNAMLRADYYVAEDGHTVLRGAAWHWPTAGDPTRCGVPGCDRVLGHQPAPDSGDDQSEELADEDPTDEEEDTQ